jgi:phosphopantetheinyl transferase
VNVAGEGWLVRSVASLEREFGARALSWLHTAEFAQLERFRSAERRRTWLWGRVVAKRLLSVAFRSAKDASSPPWQIEIRSRRDELGIAPTAWLGSEKLPVHLSIAHADDVIAVAGHVNRRIGIDVVPSTTGFPASADWAIKEAAFKCLPAGTPFQPGLLRVDLLDDSATWLHVPSQQAGRARLLTHRALYLALAWSHNSTAFSLAS